MISKMIRSSRIMISKSRKNRKNRRMLFHGLRLKRVFGVGLNSIMDLKMIISKLDCIKNRKDRRELY